ncbi:trafficking protein particle complex II-specific subunit 130 homolog [Lactuca sativa]|uniref:trafficking protein particle complex II-specific subunit 130 homolog n=1 Tax=Lactuca sativa TaxID=4236 RepID=UPI0022B0162D|nr:trafficking protein particle complex II-specific subunit 130 homolog [Lactuca sativa]
MEALLKSLTNFFTCVSSSVRSVLASVAEETTLGPKDDLRHIWFRALFPNRGLMWFDKWLLKEHISSEPHNLNLAGFFQHLNIFAIICRTIVVHFTNPFHVSTRVADKCSDGTLLLQVILHSQVKANLTIHDSWLDLKDGFTLAGESQSNGRPTSAFFPLVVPSTSRAGILFTISLPTNDEAKDMNPDSDTILNIKYKISGDRNHGSHTPMFEDESSQMLTFKSALVLQRPVLEPCLAVGFLPLPPEGLRVGQLFTMKWRVERLKYLEDEQYDEVVYEINANSENWMIAGRKRGHAPLSTKQGSRIEISILCVPLVAGYMRPPQLELPDIGEGNISCNPAGPHLVCVSPPPLSSSFCIPIPIPA